MFGVLAEVVPEHVLTPVATDVDRAWSVLPDAGTRLRDRLETHPDERFDRWVDVVGDHAVCSGRSPRTPARLLALGVPDMRPDGRTRARRRRLDRLDGLDDALRGRAGDGSRAGRGVRRAGGLAGPSDGAAGRPARRERC